ncbi:zinc-binding dehydrogenase [Desulfobacula phenolica]|uniref:S-(Hydroxymethyl)glutathione dehydrogenase / alcohol dehydrogenase n=1 Tax=Desulfobacula phenolica TaxID=90732 RepID=A0A1H2DRX9_9BACT|nr:zinc-binding dehydrogenase [Desulfobacula phenolica]SDT85511.1 S-(hydroxymethyl)glutathione dehydrogenase / alcohol dehydrogenase [Desulfobacula phenolica]
MEFPDSMRAAVLVKQSYPLQIEHVQLPEKLNYGQVLVKVHYSGICGSQIGEIDGIKGNDPFLPHLLGHEGSGEVLAVGPCVRRIKSGDKVVMHWRKGSGIDSPLPEYQWNGKKLNAGFVTTFNEYAVVSENRVTVIPENFPMDIAPLFGCAVTTGLGVINNNAKLKIGESIVVFGAGGVGLNVIQGAAMVSAHPIIAVDIYDNRLEKAAQFGATHLINSRKEDVRASVLKITGKTGADAVIDNTGDTDVINLGYELTSVNGRTILVGVPAKGDNISIYSLPLHFEKNISGSHGGEANPSIDIPNYIRLYQNGKLNLDHLITDRFTLGEINIAMDKMRSGKITGRCLIKM